MIVSPVITANILRKMGEIKTVSVLTRLVAPCSLGAVLNDQMTEVGKIFLAAIVGMVVPKNEEGQN